ncbi:MFS transporter [Streptomyces sp. ISL-94]|uniref:MFS transporter n=1 Tax=Streptomyces sp. ISL-94 TaxID=2819190 RepID=UPI001BE928D0|nr:MFS transporter [Streptomyces sp. ISL-94]MBT2480062.1 MFS transporter [Streptomyces sp. ISL-94]
MPREGEAGPRTRGPALVGPSSRGAPTALRGRARCGRLGRRRLLIGGSAGYIFFTLACAMAPHVNVLIAARFLQGVAGAVGVVLARAVITDLFHGPDIPRYFAVLAQIVGVAPVAAPVLGGAILAASTWRAVFAVLCLIGVLLLGVLAKVPESLPPERRHKGGPSGTFRAMGRRRDRLPAGRPLRREQLPADGLHHACRPRLGRSRVALPGPPPQGHGEATGTSH